ncbi:MAG: flavodoxin domain-containing protein [Coriobacteriia bacterium]|nr:flavodoxin domain-containing protein [Coriobacteriia bacterium]
MPTQMTRREFVTTTAVLGAAAAAGGLTGCAASVEQDSALVPTPSTSYGGGLSVSKRVFVGYATGTGSTVGVAEMIGETLGKRGFDVDVKPMKDQPSLDGYEAVILGSAVNGGHWLPEAEAFVVANGDPLGKVPVALFCVHAMNTGPEAKKVARRQAYLDKVRETVKPVAEGYFVGVGPNDAESNWFTRTMFRTFGGDIEGDGRDWNAIKAWAEQVPV